VILLVLWRRGLWRTLDGEKMRYFFGRTTHPLFRSRRHPPYRRLSWFKLLLSPRYASAVADWLTYRADLYDGRQG